MPTVEFVFFVHKRRNPLCRAYLLLKVFVFSSAESLRILIIQPGSKINSRVALFYQIYTCLEPSALHLVYNKSSPLLGGDSNSSQGDRQKSAAE